MDIIGGVSENFAKFASAKNNLTKNETDNYIFVHRNALSGGHAERRRPEAQEGL